MLRVENVSLKYQGQTILNHITFSINKGRIVGLVGQNGAGKSSIIKVLAGLVFVKTGDIFLNNECLTSFTKIHKCFGFLIDSPSFYPYLTAKQNLRLVKKINNNIGDIDSLLLQVGLTNVESKKVKNFSTGMKQRLSIATALLKSPEFIILDEPFNGLDPNGFHDLIVLIKKLNNDGVTFLISSHLLADLEELADMFILLHKGSVALEITKEKLKESLRKVTFTFGKTLNHEVSVFIKKLQGEFVKDTKVVIKLYPNEIANVVTKFVSLNSPPINIETHTILQEKYFEVTK